MYIILPNADFSLSNLGKIELKTDVSNDTKALLDIYGKSTWNLTQKLAIDDFLVALKASTIWGKIDRLVMPILAPLNAKIRKLDGNPIAFFDIKNNIQLEAAFGGAYSASYTEEACIVNNGFKFFAYTPYGASNSIGFKQALSSVWNFSNSHVGAYYQRTVTTDALIIHDIGSSAQLAIRESDIRIGNPNPVTGTYDSNTKFNRGLKIISALPNSVTGLNNGLPFASSVPRATPAGTYNDILILLNRYSSNTNFDTVLSLITIGKALTQEETVMYNTLISTLMDKLWT